MLWLKSEIFLAHCLKGQKSADYFHSLVKGVNSTQNREMTQTPSTHSFISWQGKRYSGKCIIIISSCYILIFV